MLNKTIMFHSSSFFSRTYIYPYFLLDFFFFFFDSVFF